LIIVKIRIVRNPNEAGGRLPPVVLNYRENPHRA